MPEYLDFSHRDYRPDHEPNPTPKGIPYDFFGLNPQKAGALALKLARKAHHPTRGTARKSSGRSAAAIMSRAANKK